MKDTRTDQQQSTTPLGLEDSALIDVKAVCLLTGFTTSEPIYRRLREKSGFPEPIRLSKRCTRWRLRDIRAWIEAQGKDATR